MDKIRVILYIIIIIIALGLLWTAMENNKTNKELVKTINFCNSYYEHDWDKIESVCQAKQINKYLETKNYILPIPSE